MAFNRKKLSGNMGAGSYAPKSFTYIDTDSTKAQIVAADYFLDVTEVLDVGDTLYVYGSNGGANVHVTAATAVTVTVAENSVA